MLRSAGYVAEKRQRDADNGARDEEGASMSITTVRDHSCSFSSQDCGFGKKGLPRNRGHDRSDGATADGAALETTGHSFGGWAAGDTTG